MVSLSGNRSKELGVGGVRVVRRFVRWSRVKRCLGLAKPHNSCFDALRALAPDRLLALQHLGSGLVEAKLDFPSFVVELAVFSGGVLGWIEQGGQQPQGWEALSLVVDDSDVPDLGERGDLATCLAVDLGLSKYITAAQARDDPPFVVLPCAREPMTVFPVGFERDEIAGVGEVAICDKQRLVRNEVDEFPCVMTFACLEGTASCCKQQMAAERHQCDETDEGISTLPSRRTGTVSTEVRSVIRGIPDPNRRAVQAEHVQAPPLRRVCAADGPLVGSELEQPLEWLRAELRPPLGDGAPRDLLLATREDRLQVLHQVHDRQVPEESHPQDEPKHVGRREPQPADCGRSGGIKGLLRPPGLDGIPELVEGFSVYRAFGDQLHATASSNGDHGIMIFFRPKQQRAIEPPEFPWRLDHLRLSDRH